jgi:predicted phosphodiesterase
MRIAALYDIHGNLPALEAVLNEIRGERIDQIVVGGDVLPGPMPREAIDRLVDTRIPVACIRGNGDREVLAFMSGTQTEWYRAARPEWKRPIEWTAQQLDAGHARFIAGWPLTHEIDHPELGRVLFCHATPQNDTDCFTQRTPDERVTRLLGGVNASMVVCGHTHMPFDRRIGDIRVVNAGSVGMPFGEAGADWLLLASEVQLRHTTYDLDAAAARVRATNYPDAADFAARYVLQPPSADEMLEVFSRAESV